MLLEEQMRLQITNGLGRGKIVKLVDTRPYYEVEDYFGNTGMYRLDQLADRPKLPK